MKLQSALMAGVLTAFSFNAVYAHHDDDDNRLADPLELVTGDDGVASLPVFNGPFPETRDMRFLSQIAPDDLGAEPRRVGERDDE